MKVLCPMTPSLKVSSSLYPLNSFMPISRHLLRQDCAPGTCYEGTCLGDKMYSTDGSCGDQYGGRICAGIWGDCCNFNGTCGTGTAFCAMDSCQSGNCTWAISPPTPPDWSYGNSTDGTCGAANTTCCGSLWGNCCNQDNVCGSLPSDCGVGW
jgi:hypothetical protein